MEQEIERIKQEVDKTSKVNDKMQEAIKNNSKATEAISALQVLGYNKKEIEKAFEKLDVNELTVEEIIRKGLSILGR